MPSSSGSVFDVKANSNSVSFDLRGTAGNSITNASMGNVVVGGLNNKHDKLKNRELPDQHPMDAITGLEDAIATIPTAMTEQEILDVLI